MEKTETLKDGATVTIRELRLDDLDQLMKFYRALPLEDRKYLRIDVTKRRIVVQRLRRMEAGEVIRIIALHNEEIIADGALELSGEQWVKHRGEIRLIIARPFQKKGLGKIMLRELYFIALQQKMEIIVAQMMRPQVGAQKILRKLGFREETLLPDHVKDIEGTVQDLIIMSCNVKDFIQDLDQFISDSDWQRCR